MIACMQTSLKSNQRKSAAEKASQMLLIVALMKSCKARKIPFGAEVKQWMTRPKNKRNLEVAQRELDRWAKTRAAAA
jgi:hypothetical protein